MSDDTYSPGAWRIGEGRWAGYVVSDDSPRLDPPQWRGVDVLAVAPPRPGEPANVIADVKFAADRRRIVAAINAVAGIPTEILEKLEGSGAFQDLVRHGDWSG